MKATKLVVRNEKIVKAFECYKEKIKEYNKKVSGMGYYLKPVHIVTKKVGEEIRIYRYFGKYWWKIEYLGLKGNKPVIKWIYIGKNKPIESLPDPPINPLEGFSFYTLKGDKDHIYVSERTYTKFQNKIEKILLGEKICSD
ncbi:hypothetical protein [Fervidicoccus sp.]|uniref:Uncharacterized protein n=1 Tax=Fervidicoccus fontis TaxID=683846 RepID=A0A7C2VHF3_9CREN|nr:hypothetical protein [Fervidicoccus fontis]